jgi:hypothetical protein
MTASPGREVDANLLSGAAPGSAQPRAEPQDAGGQDLGDLVEALGGVHQVGMKGVRSGRRSQHGHPVGSCDVAVSSYYSRCRRIIPTTHRAQITVDYAPLAVAADLASS